MSQQGAHNFFEAIIRILQALLHGQCVRILNNLNEGSPIIVL